MAVQQLEANVSSLRLWLAKVEHELGTPVSYSECTMAEVQRKLYEQQVLNSFLRNTCFL